MVIRRYPRDRRCAFKKHKVAGRESAQRVARHRLYGEIPLIREATTGQDGKLYEWYRCDPDFAPALPRGSVRGDVRKQVFCGAHHVPKYFFVGEERTCVQCAERFVFRAREQKYWYETLKFNFCSVPIRCVGCRRQRRSEHALREQIARARQQVRVSTGDPAAQLSLARAIVEYHERTNHGDLDEAISGARKAASLWPESPEPLLWEGMAQSRAGRKAKARQCLRAFLSRGGRRAATLDQRAREYLAQATKGVIERGDQ